MNKQQQPEPEAPNNLLGFKEAASEAMSYMNKLYVGVKQELSQKIAECLEKDNIIMEKEKAIKELNTLLLDKESSSKTLVI